MQNRTHRGIRIAIYMIVTLLLVGFDQFTKALAVNKLKNQADFSVLKGVLSFSYLENDGMAWGMLGGKRVVFIVMTTVLLALIGIVIYRLEYVKTAENKKVMTALEIDLFVLIAGALGNFIDRIRMGYVVDFIRTDFITFPVFNVADCYVTVSMVILIILVLFFVKEEELDKLLSLRKKASGE